MARQISADQLAKPMTNLAAQDRLAVLWDEHEMVVAQITRYGNPCDTNASPKVPQAP